MRSQLYSDLLFATGIVQAARIHALQVPVYFYLFCVMGKNNMLSNYLRPENPTGGYDAHTTSPADLSQLTTTTLWGLVAPSECIGYPGRISV